MYVEAKGDIFEGNADYLVCPVNTVGVMGAGLALQFKLRYPFYYDDYARLCNKAMLSPQRIDHVYYVGDRQYIISFPTKLHWRSPSKLIYIKDGLTDMTRYFARQPSPKVVHVPALGCGLGGLSVQDVKPLMIEAFSRPEVGHHLFRLFL